MEFAILVWAVSIGMILVSVGYLIGTILNWRYSRKISAALDAELAKHEQATDRMIEEHNERHRR